MAFFTDEDAYFDVLIYLLETNKELQNASRGSSSVTFLTAAVGMVAGGLIGGITGASAGCLVGSWIGRGLRTSSDNKPINKRLETLSREKKRELVRQLQELVGDSSVKALTTYISTASNRDALLRILNQY